MCRNDNDNDDEYCNYNALLRFLITNNMIPDLHGFNFKALIIIVIIVDYCDPLGMSDHVSLLIYLNFESTHISKLPKRMYYNGNYILMNEFFNGFNWTLLLDALNTQECWDLFTDKVDYAIEKFIPINDKKSTSKDWVNCKVRYEIKNKNRHGQNYGRNKVQ